MKWVTVSFITLNNHELIEHFLQLQIYLMIQSTLWYNPSNFSLSKKKSIFFYFIYSDAPSKAMEEAGKVNVLCILRRLGITISNRLSYIHKRQKEYIDSSF